MQYEDESEDLEVMDEYDNGEDEKVQKDIFVNRAHELISRNKFNEYGRAFPGKLIAGLLTDVAFGRTIASTLNVEFFETDVDKWFIKKCLVFFEKYRKFPSNTDYFLAEARELKVKQQNTLLNEVFLYIDELSEYVLDTDLAYVKEKALEFCKRNGFRIALEKASILVQEDDIESLNKVQKIISDALMIGNDPDALGYDYSGLVENRYEIDARNPLAFPWEALNEITQGGVGAGDLVIFMAPTGGGKSLLLADVGKYWVFNLHKRVLHITLELKAEYISMRYDANLIGESTEVIRGDAELRAKLNETIQEQLKGGGELIPLFRYSGSIDVNNIRNIMEMLTLRNRKPDAIIVDYADLLKPQSNTNKNTNNADVLGAIYEALKGLAGEYDVPILTASQTTRGTSTQAVIGGDSIAGSMKKLNAADMAFALSRGGGDAVVPGVLNVVKNRYGTPGIIFPCTLYMKLSRVEVENRRMTESEANSQQKDLEKEITARAFKQATGYSKSGGSISSSLPSTSAKKPTSMGVLQAKASSFGGNNKQAESTAPPINQQQETPTQQFDEWGDPL